MSIKKPAAHHERCIRRGGKGSSSLARKNNPYAERMKFLHGDFRGKIFFHAPYFENESPRERLRDFVQGKDGNIFLGPSRMFQGAHRTEADLGRSRKFVHG